MADHKEPKTATVSKEDIEQGKTMAIVTYLGLIGLVVALATDGKKNEFVRFHMNQAIPAILVSLIPFVGWAACIILILLGIINASQGEMKRLPVVGNFEIIK